VDETKLLDLRVGERRPLSDGVIGLVLDSAGGGPLPAWEAGAHLELRLPNGLARQYSLCGRAADREAYTLAVLREPQSRGGSRFIHDELAVGTVLEARPPRNNFALEPAPAYRFVAGGIGITPILPMIAACAAARSDWRLHYGGRSRGGMAFLADLASHGEAVSLYPEDEVGLLDLDAVFDGLGGEDLIYVCGPPGLIEAVRERADRDAIGSRLRYELFEPLEPDPAHEPDDAGFEVVLARTGLTLTVGPDKTILECMIENGVQVFTDCEEGICGTCEIGVLEGEVEHRDDVLSAEEKEAGRSMMVCVSRAKGRRLVLDA
jgi:ferredoxin-NADP reductase